MKSTINRLSISRRPHQSSVLNRLKLRSSFSICKPYDAVSNSSFGQHGYGGEMAELGDTSGNLPKLLEDIKRLDGKRAKGAATANDLSLLRALENEVRLNSNLSHRDKLDPASPDASALGRITSAAGSLTWAAVSGLGEGIGNIGGAVKDLGVGLARAIWDPVAAIEGIINALNEGIWMLRQDFWGTLKNAWNNALKNPKVFADFGVNLLAIVTPAALKGKPKPAEPVPAKPLSGSDFITPPESPVPFGGKPIQIGAGIDPPVFNPPVPPKPAAPSSGAGAATQPNRINSARLLIRSAEESGPFRNFPESFNQQIFQQGTRTVTPNFYNVPKTGLANDSILYRLPGSAVVRRGGVTKLYEGTYEIGVRPSVSGNTEVIIHRFFNPTSVTVIRR